MRVLMLHNDYAETGGEYFSVRAEMAALSKANVSARLVSVENSEVLARSGSKGLLWQTITSRSAASDIKTAIDEFKPDIIHAQNIFPLMGRGAIDAIRASRIPWVRTLRNYRVRCISGVCFRDGRVCTDCSSASRGLPGVRHACYRSSTPASAAALAYAVLEQAATRQYPPSAYIILSTAMQRLLSANLGTVPVFVKPNSVPGGLHVSPVPRKSRTNDFIYVGRFSEEKGISQLISDFASHPELKLVLIGSGALDERSLTTLNASSNISLAGELSATDVRARMRDALAVLVPSQWDEPFGRVAAEALAAGTPALVSNRGGLPDIVSAITQHNLIVGDTDSWADSASAIASLEQTPYDDLAKSCFLRWKSTYEPDTVSEQLVEIYRAVLEAHGIEGEA